MDLLAGPCQVGQDGLIHVSSLMVRGEELWTVNSHNEAIRVPTMGLYVSLLTCEESLSISWDPENYGWLVITLTDVTWHHLIPANVRLRDNWITHCARYWLNWPSPCSLRTERAQLHRLMWCTDILFYFTSVLHYLLNVEIVLQSSLNLERWMIRFIIKDGNSNLNILVRIGLADIVLADARSDYSLTFLAARWLWLQLVKPIPHPPSTFIYNLYSFSSHL